MCLNLISPQNKMMETNIFRSVLCLTLLVPFTCQLDELTYQAGTLKLANVQKPSKETFLKWSLSGPFIAKLLPGDVPSQVNFQTDPPGSSLSFRRLAARLSDCTEYEFIWRNFQQSISEFDNVCFVISNSMQQPTQWYPLYNEREANWPMGMPEEDDDDQDDAKHFFTSGPTYGPMLENALLNTDGFALIFDELLPLIVSKKPKGDSNVGGRLCFTLQSSLQYFHVYPTSPEHPSRYGSLKMRILAAPNIRAVHRALLRLRYINTPNRQPDRDFFATPIWSYSTIQFLSVRQEKYDGLNALIIQGNEHELITGNNPFKVDFSERSWQPHLGELVFADAMVPRQLKTWFTEFNARVEVSVGPKVDPGSAWALEFPNSPRIMDFSNATHRARFLRKLKFSRNILTDNFTPLFFKFLSGSVADFTDKGKVLSTDEITRKYPNFISSQYAQTGAQLGDSSTYSTAFKSQAIPLYFRLEITVDLENPKASLKELLVKVFTLSLAGYQFFLVEPVFAKKEAPSEEWLLCWLQVTSLFPGLYLSYPYWTVTPPRGPSMLTFVQSLLTLRSEFAPEFNRLADEWITAGKPVIQPMFLAAPDDPDSYEIWDQFLLGEKILVAPMVDWVGKPNERKRKIYFPPGKWNNPCVEFTGRVTVSGDQMNNKSNWLYALDKYSLLIYLRDDYEGILNTTKYCPVS